MCRDEKCNERYNGWANRETWALNLWLSNDAGLYEMTQERVAASVADYKSGYPVSDGQNCNDVLPTVAGDAIRDLWAELMDPAEGLLLPEDLLAGLREVGSVWRVDFDEVGAAWLEGIES